MSLNLQAPVSTLFTSNSSSNVYTNPSNALNTTNASYASVGNNSIGGVLSGINSITTVGQTSGNAVNANYYGYYWPYWEPYNNYYKGCYHTFTTPDKFETAFKLARKLMDKKLVKPQKTVEDFFKLMDSIVEIL